MGKDIGMISIHYTLTRLRLVLEKTRLNLCVASGTCATTTADIIAVISFDVAVSMYPGGVTCLEKDVCRHFALGSLSFDIGLHSVT